MYKLFKDTLTDTYSIHKVGTQISFLPDPANREYQQFVNDIYKKGTGIIEGADVQTEIPYADARAAEYPPLKEQLDKIYHDGIDAWKAEIKVIKDKYPKTQVGITTTEALPSWIDAALFEKQKEKYIEATLRLKIYELSAGLKDENGEYLIKPLPLVVLDSNQISNIRNPLIVRDETQRKAAQDVINNTPQAVIDSINT
jgi:hypothetical protein